MTVTWDMTDTDLTIATLMARRHRESLMATSRRSKPGTVQLVTIMERVDGVFSTTTITLTIEQVEALEGMLADMRRILAAGRPG